MPLTKDIIMSNTVTATPNNFVQGDIVEWRNEYGVLSGNFRGITHTSKTAIIVVNGYQMEAPLAELYSTDA